MYFGWRPLWEVIDHLPLESAARLTEREMYEARYGVKRQRPANVQWSFLMTVGLLCGSIFFGVDPFLLQQRGVQTDGTVAELIYQRNSKCQSRLRSIEVDFTTLDGVHQRFSNRMVGPMMNGCHFRGERVAVIYDPKHPRRASVNSQLALWFLPGTMFFFGIASLVYTIIYWPMPDRAVQAAPTNMHVAELSPGKNEYIAEDAAEPVGSEWR